jgi:poly [ADP-ribose] polymerase 2/3/4
MLDTLTDMGVANDIMKTSDSRHKDANSVSKLDQRFQQLKLKEMTPLDPKSKEYKALKDYLINTAGHTHSIRYRLQDIFRIERDGEDDRFNKSQFSKIKDKNRRLLWHGSRSTNFGGILSQGLRIAPPEAPVNGYAFGKGVYLADISTKSANYCVASSSGNHGLLLLCEAELGNPMYELLSGDSAAQEKCENAGSIATYGIGRSVPQSWVDAGDAIDPILKGIQMPDPKKPPQVQTYHPNAYLQYNEYICYDVKQIRMRYLLRFSL